MRKNQKIIITVGIPASGKSTFANNLIATDLSFVKIERDDFRYAFKNIGYGDKKFEEFITDIQYKAIHSALNNKFNVIISDTNCNLKYLKILLEEFKHKADVELKFFNIDLYTAYVRDSERERTVGIEVIDRMLKGFNEVFSEYSENDSFSKVPYIHKNRQNLSLPNCIIVDLDGTIAHSNGKRGYYEWSKVGEDDEDVIISNLVSTYLETGNNVIFLTGRSNECRKETYLWIDNVLGIQVFTLLMRDKNDFRPSTVVKKELYEKNIKGRYNVDFALDDKEDICEMWRKEGIKALLTMSDK